MVRSEKLFPARVLIELGGSWLVTGPETARVIARQIAAAADQAEAEAAAESGTPLPKP